MFRARHASEIFKPQRGAMAGQSRNGISRHGGKELEWRVQMLLVWNGVSPPESRAEGKRDECDSVRSFRQRMTVEGIVMETLSSCWRNGKNFVE